MEEAEWKLLPAAVEKVAAGRVAKERIMNIAVIERQ